MKRTLLLIAIAVMAITSCTKEKDHDTPDPLPASKVKTSTSNSGTTSYQYDDMGRRTQALYADGSRIDYEYTNGFVNEKSYNNAGNFLYTYTQELNNDGLAIKETKSNDPSYLRTRTYNSSKQVLGWVSTSGPNQIIASFFYNNGNCDSVRFSLNGNWTYTERNTYYTELPNTLNGMNFGTQHYGIGNKNLGKTTQNFFANGTINPVSTSTYEFDLKGRVTKATYLYNGNSDYNLYTY